ncbi:MAG: tetratricopeptide repeat protein [Rubrobacteraceae bacterium]|nr:tetratricopeptide repeat protein [Rubrobacteraceae bacterium]
MADSPGGTVTLLFTDIEGSTRLWEEKPEAMRSALARHDEILKEAIEQHGGRVFKTVGDAFCAVFRDAPDATGAALAGQRALFAKEWDEACVIRARMALHAGEAEERGGDYFGPTLNRVARLLSAGHGGQTLLSLAAKTLAGDQLPSGAELRDMGERRLKDLTHPEHVFQLTAPDLPAEFPPLKTLDERRNNLPVQPTPLIGRGREVAEVCERLRGPEIHLLTLIGPGGTGKTRLSLQASVELLDEFRDGVFFVELAAERDPSLVATTVARTFGLIETADQTAEESVNDYVRSRELLLVLDNFEQVVDAAPFVGGLLSSAPKLRVLATSRIALGVYGETEYAVPPMELPDPKRLPPLDILDRYASVRLFVERARAVKAGFALTAENAPAVAEICARLDGLPLAIELAASRTRVLTPQAMLKRLGDRLKLLAGGARSLPARQQTLRGAIGWSHDLLGGEDRILFRRMAVFAGGRTFEAMEAVCAPEGEPDVLDGVQSLAEKSLLRQEEGPENEPRFVMLETIHEYAREKLEESGEADEIKRLHAEYFHFLAEEAEPELKGPEQVEWMDRLEAEHDNFRAALSWSLGGSDAALGLRMAKALWRFWWARGHFGEGVQWLEQALAGDAAAPMSARAGALSGLANLLREQGDLERARAPMEEALAMYHELGDAAGTAVCMTDLGFHLYIEGDDERAAELIERGLALARESKDEWSIADALAMLAVVATIRDDRDRAVVLWTESLMMSRSRGDVRTISANLANMGYQLVSSGDHEQAELLFEEALTLARKAKDRQQIGLVFLGLGMSASGRDDYERAAALLEDSLMASWEIGDKQSVVESLEGLAGVAGARDKHGLETRLWGAVVALREALGIPWSSIERALHERSLESARSRLDETTVAAAWEEGAAMTLEEAVAYALGKEAGG